MLLSSSQIVDDTFSEPGLDMADLSTSFVYPACAYNRVNPAHSHIISVISKETNVTVSQQTRGFHLGHLGLVLF